MEDRDKDLFPCQSRSSKYSGSDSFTNDHLHPNAHPYDSYLLRLAELLLCYPCRRLTFHLNSVDHNFLCNKLRLLSLIGLTRNQTISSLLNFYHPFNFNFLSLSYFSGVIRLKHWRSCCFQEHHLQHNSSTLQE